MKSKSPFRFIEVIPSKNLKITNPETGERLSVESSTRVPLNAYWTRKIESGDVLKVSPAEQKHEPVNTEKKSKSFK